MTRTVASMLELPLMGDAEVLSGASLLDDRRVVGVSVIEVPVERFVGRGEFILSTAMGVGHDEAALAGFVEEVAASGAVALALSCGPYLSEVPETVVRLAERIGLPLIVLPWELRFADVIEAVLRRVIEDQRVLKLREDFAWSLVTGGFASEKLVVAQGEHLGYDLRKGYVCAVGRLELNDPADPGKATELSREVLDVALDTATGGLRAELAAAAGGDVMLFAQTEIASEVDPLLESISERALARGLPVVSWGVGEVALGVRSFQRSYSEAAQAVAIGHLTRGGGSVTHIGQTGANRLLMSVASAPESRDLQARFLGPLLAHEERTGVPLVSTLETLFEAGGNLSEAARRLHLHRLSLKNRLERVEQLLARRLSDPDLRFALEMAVRLRQMEENSP